MGAALGVDALVSESQALDRLSPNEVFADDLFGVFGLDVAVPHCLRVDDHDRAMFTLIEAAGFVDADFAGEASSLGEHLKLRNEVALTVFGAGRARCAFRAGILTDKYVTLKRCQNGKSSKHSC
jgi:hypothetical protein